MSRALLFVQVIVKMIVAPVNPADINTIQGTYPVKPPLPSVPGFEGIGEVVEIGSGVTNLVPGDRVIPDGAIGTWCTAGIFNSKQLRKVSRIEQNHFFFLTLLIDHFN